MTEEQELIRQGAEARIYKTTIDGQAAIAKQRFSKAYRHPDLDKKLTKGRLNQEARSLRRCRENRIKVPSVIKTDKDTSTLYMEFVEGKTLKEWINDNTNSEKEKELMTVVGRTIVKMHTANIIHGDLTTSNMIIDENGDLVMIDFGLSFISQNAEDKAVDLYVLERAFISTHPNSEILFSTILESYGDGENQAAQVVLKRLEAVRQRGRKRDMSG